MNTTTALTADALVVGFGKGGKTAAHALTDAGRRVILIEQSDEMYGGTCPNVGCVPTKMLVHYSNSKRLEDEAQEFFANSIEGVRALTSAFPPLSAQISRRRRTRSLPAACPQCVHWRRPAGEPGGGRRRTGRLLPRVLDAAGRGA